MNLRYFLLLFLLSFSTVFAQKSNINPTHIEYLTKRVHAFYDVLSVEELDLILRYSDENPFIATNWDNDVLNPYDKIADKQPFNLKFTDSLFASPILIDKVITSRYGWRNRRPHKGIDIDLVTGDTVRALLDGKVRYVGYNRGHGKTIIIRHANGLEMVYAHLSKRLVKENDLISKGQLIGKGGATGNARGSHLHLEIIFKGNHINPEYLFDFSRKNSIRGTNIWVTDKWTTPILHSSRRQSKIEIASTLEEAKELKKVKFKIHIIRRGDTLSRIAQRNGVSISSLCKLNGIKRTKILKLGSRIKIIQ